MASIASKKSASSTELTEIPDFFSNLDQDQPSLETTMEAVSHVVINLTIFVLAIYVGYHVVWTVTPALHTPLMAVTNAVSAIVIIGAMLAAALTVTPLGKVMGLLAVALAAVNVFGGFLVTRRMLEMFKKKEKKAGARQ
jgi:NAD(P) transhydrogenase subunit alpha